jgi:hypothetical protein
VGARGCDSPGQPDNVKHDQIGRAGIGRKSELFGLVTRALQRLQQLPDIVRGVFRDPALAYIGM